MLTTQHYVANNGGCCPLCRSRQVEATDDFSILERGQIARGMKCLECRATWTEGYSLSYFCALEINGRMID